MKLNKATLAVAMLGLMTMAPQRIALAGVIGVDDRISFTSRLATGSDFTLFRETIERAGHTIVPLLSFQGTLTGLDALIIRQHSVATLAASEISSIHAFVAAGGGLLMASEGGTGSDDTSARFNSLAQPYGVTYNVTGIGEFGAGLTITGFVDHPVTLGITQVGVDFERRMVSIQSPAIDLTLGGGEQNFLAAVTGQPGQGNVVLISDTSLWGNPVIGNDRPITFGDNRRLLQNILASIVPEPSTLVLAMWGLVAGQRFRLPANLRHNSRAC